MPSHFELCIKRNGLAHTQQHRHAQPHTANPPVDSQPASQPSTVYGKQSSQKSVNGMQTRYLLCRVFSRVRELRETRKINNQLGSQSLLRTTVKVTAHLTFTVKYLCWKVHLYLGQKPNTPHENQWLTKGNEHLLHVLLHFCSNRLI